MNYVLEFHPEIEKDINEAYSWYESQKDGLGEQFFIAIRKKLESIGRFPELYGTKGNGKYREAIVAVFPFAIVYIIYKRKHCIFVSSIHHFSKRTKTKYR